MVVAGKRRSDSVWHTMQHEGWHQFVHMVIRGHIPTWVDEGLAEYFGCGIWTGDGLVTGVIPPNRLRRVKELIKTGKILPFPKMLEMTRRQWNANLSGRNYDQAWSMCHFLVHADGGKYREAFGAFIKDVSRNRPRRQAFVARFGGNVKAFQQRYESWWLSLPDDPTADVRTLAVVQTLTSYLARAKVMKLKFYNVEDFFTAAKEGKISPDPRRYPDLWLPTSLLEKVMQQARRLKVWSLEGRMNSIVLKLPDGSTFRGKFMLRTPARPKVWVTHHPARKKR